MGFVALVLVLAASLTDGLSATHQGTGKEPEKQFVIKQKNMKDSNQLSGIDGRGTPG
jgi:hypothetical protein